MHLKTLSVIFMLPVVCFSAGCGGSQTPESAQSSTSEPPEQAEYNKAAPEQTEGDEAREEAPASVLDAADVSSVEVEGTVENSGQLPASGPASAGGASAPAVFLDEAAVEDGEIAFQFQNIPAVSSNGKQVVFDFQAEDGARGNLNLKVVVRNVKNDKIVHEEVILDPDEFDDMIYDDDEMRMALVKKLTTRIERTNEYLSRGSWKPMVTDEIEYDRYDDDARYDLENRPQKFRIRNLRVTYDEPLVTVKKANGKKLYGRRHTEWMAQDFCADPENVSPKSPKCLHPCTNPSFLRQVSVSADSKLLLLRISYTGTDMCWEPDGDVHTIRLK